MLHQHHSLTHVFRFILAVAMAAVATAASASFHTFAIEQVYSNADGTVQYVVLHETQGSNGAERVVRTRVDQHARGRHEVVHVSRRPAQRSAPPASACSSARRAWPRWASSRRIT